MMDPIEWIVSLGNINLATFYHKTFGFGYLVFKLILYGIILAMVVKFMYNRWKYYHQVEILVSGPDHTLTSKMDRGRVVQTKEGVVKYQLLRSKLTLPMVPTNEHIVPLKSKFFWQPLAKVTLYKYGHGKYSIVPVSYDINDKKVKFKPIEPLMGPIKADIKAGMSMINKPNKWRDFAPIVIAFIPFLIFSILLYMIAGQFVHAADSIKQGVNAQTQAFQKFVEMEQTKPVVLTPKEMTIKEATIQEVPDQGLDKFVNTGNNEGG